jgi:hypothetical protein
MLTAAAPEIPGVLLMPNSRRQNRETFVRLFQGFVNEYGEVAGKKIINHIVDQAGGMRIWVPASNPKLNQYASLDNDPLHGCSACFRRLWVSTCHEFGQASGRAIMNKIICEISGLCHHRVHFPSHRDLYRWERDEKMQNQYTGDNIAEIALRWNMSVPQALKRVRRRED